MKNSKALALVATLVPAAVVAGSALAYTVGDAGSGATNGLAQMDTFLAVLVSWISGPLGVILAISALTLGLAVGLAQQSLMAGAIGIFFAALVNYGPAVLQGVAGSSEVSAI